MFTSLSIGFSILRSIITEKTMITEIEQEVQTSQQIDLYLFISMIIISILLIVGRLYYKKNLSLPKGETFGWNFLKKIFFTRRKIKGSSTDELFEKIKAAGYLYDKEQDIFYSDMDPWQKNMGYCSFYDEAAILSGMIIDCEPIKFIYNDKEWLIEFWKGQYGMNTGCEIGVYIREDTNLNISGLYKEAFYKGVKDEDKLQMSFSLKKGDRTLFIRADKHWWLTGFKLGEFSQPSELSMDLSITLKDLIMRDEFIKALENVGYLKDEIFIDKNTVSLIFHNPRTKQPSMRIEELDWITQRKNKMFCDKYQELTNEYHTFPDKMEEIKKKAPELYNKIINIGKSKEIFSQYEKFKDKFK